MANKASLWAQLLLIAKLVDNIGKFGNYNTPNFLGMSQALQAAYEGNHIASTQSQVAAIRTSLNAMLVNSQTLLTPVILELAKVGYGSKASSVEVALDDIAAGMAGSETVKNRAYTYDDITAGGSNVGTGTIYRCLEDRFGNSIEEGYKNAGDIVATISKDRWQGKTAGNEDATIAGSGVAYLDEIEPGDCFGTPATLTAKRSDNSLTALTNPSFDTVSGTGLTFLVSGWTLSDADHFQKDATNFYRTPASGTPYALEFLENASVSRYLSTLAINPLLPVFCILRYRRKTSCDGALELRVGSKTVSVADLTQKTNAVWYDLVFGIDSDGWYENFRENYSNSGIRIAVTLSARSTGTLLIDDMILAQPVKFDGKYYLMTAGATDYVNGDVFTWEDTVANTGRTQLMIATAFNKYLPHTSGTPTYADV